MKIERYTNSPWGYYVSRVLKEIFCLVFVAITGGAMLMAALVGLYYLFCGALWIVLSASSISPWLGGLAFFIWVAAVLYACVELEGL